MYETFKKNVTIERLVEDEKRLIIDRSTSYLISYPHFLSYFKGLEKLVDHNIVIGIHFTYGWMPTMFDFRSDKSQDVLKILQSAKEGRVPDIEDLIILKEYFNNSLVGTSKILHFINPVKFAIWDSLVYEYLTGIPGEHELLTVYTSYQDYLKFCNYITSKPDFSPLKKSIEEKVGYEMTKFRAVESIMYHYMKKKPKRRSRHGVSHT